jgi:hypothetical protein
MEGEMTDTIGAVLATEGALSIEARDVHIAIKSLMEEFEAVDLYNQRAETCGDRDLQALLLHNRDEEKEHASMLLEWLRRRDARLGKELKDYLFTTTPIVKLEHGHRG